MINLVLADGALLVAVGPNACADDRLQRREILGGDERNCPGRKIASGQARFRWEVGSARFRVIQSK